LVAKYNPIFVWAGKDNITGSISPFLYPEMVKRNVYFTIDELAETVNKEQRAQPIKARSDAKAIRFPTYVPEWEQAEHELLVFPNGTRDDWVDAFSKVGQGLNKLVPAKVTKPEWDGSIPERPLTLKVIMQSHNRRERSLIMSDN
jgi:hypothetical protein